MSSPLRIRPATDADRSALRAAMVGLQEHERSLHDSRPPAEEIVDACLDRLEVDSAPRGAILVGELESAFVGFIAGRVVQNDYIAETAESNRFLYVSDIFVAPECRGNGFAAQLIDALVVRVAEPGIVWLRLAALANNASAHRAYLKAGLAPNEIVYERRLTPPT